jgi:type IV secretory pathway VirJ component
VLTKAGLGVLGWDSLRYFWHEKTPDRLAQDLDAAIARYSKEWNTRDVVLIGYSFGADVMPFAYNRLRDETRAKVKQMSLLGFTDSAEFEIHISDWLGRDSSESVPNRDELPRIPPSIVQCFYGEDEDDTICPELEKNGVETIRTTGEHHFDGDYPALARKILEGLARRTRAVPPAVSTL